MEEKTKAALSEIAKSLSQSVVKAFPYIFTEVAYKKIFYHHTLTPINRYFPNDFFPKLKAERVTFKSLENTLVGYFYHYDNYDKSKVVILVHGYANGHHRYLDVINNLAESGLLVFSYDATSFDESTGEGIYGFEQAIIDLDNAVKFVKSRLFLDKDIILIGHSMGAYSSGCYLNLNPNISKVILVSSFDKTSTLFYKHGFEWAGYKIDSTIEYIDEYEKYRFGDLASLSVSDGLRKMKGKALIIHANDDKTVPIDVGLDLYKNNLVDKNNISYITLEKAGHGDVFYSESGRAYFNKIGDEFNNYLKSKKNPTRDDEINLFNLLVDKEKWINLGNKKLFEDIIKFVKE